MHHFVWPASIAPSPPPALPPSPQKVAVCLDDDDDDDDDDEETDSEDAAEEQAVQSALKEEERELDSALEEKEQELDPPDEVKDSTQQHAALQEAADADADEDAAAEQHESSREEDVEASREAERAELRSRCQQFMLQLVAHPESEALPPWRSSDAHGLIAAEFEPLYQQLLSAVKSRSGKSSKDRWRIAREAGSGARGSLTGSSQPRHSFSLLLPAFHTLHAVARQVMMSKKKEKEAEESGDQQDDSALEPASALLPLPDVRQSDRSASAEPQPHSLSTVSAAAPSGRPRRVFFSKYNKALEMRALREARAAAASSALSSALSVTAPLPLYSSPPPLSSFLSATTPLPVSPLFASAVSGQTASLLAVSSDRPFSPSRGLAVPSQPLSSAASSPLITAHPFVPPHLARPLQLGSEAESALYEEKLEASEHSRQRCRERRERDERRRRWAERMQPKDVKKWGRRGRKRRVRMRVEDGFLLWGAAEHGQAGQTAEERRRRWRQQEREGKVIDLRGVRGVVPGLNPKLRARVQFSLSVLCFGVLGRQRVLECECADVMDRDDWMDGLLQEVDEAKTLSCSWSGRLLCSVKQDTSIQCTIAEGDEGISFI